jgi:type IV pilus secretin PilQ/predicted competence protein
MSYINGTSERRFFVQFGSVCALCATLAMPVFAMQDGTDAAADVSVTEYGTIDIAVQDTDLASVLQMLSIQSQKNIITSKSVSATVTANLYDVTFFEALEAVLRPNGYRYIEEGNFIYVYTQAEFEEIQNANRERDSRIFELDYLSASDASELISPLLSETGQVSNRGDVIEGFKPEVGSGGADSYAYNAKLVVADYVDNLDAIGELLAELDSPPQQVVVESTILQTSLDESNAFGVDISVLGSLDFTDLTDPLSAVGNLLGGADTETGFQPADNNATAANVTVGQTRSAGGLKVGIVRDDVAVFLRVLDEVTDTTVLARPKVMTLNRQRAEVLVGARVGYLSTTATETTTTQTVEFLDTGIQLIFRPFISRNGMIRMEIAPSVSEASLRTVTDANGILVTIPDELTNELTTNVRIHDGETMVIGGLFRESNRVSRRQVPLLGDIPILGAAFRGQDDTVDRSEIIFLITPSIVNDEKLWAVGADMLDYASELQVGSRANLLPFSRTKLTGNYNKDAVTAYNRGDEEMALYYANNSLRLDHNQPDMINFREMVTGGQETPHTRSLLERAFRKHMPVGRPASELGMVPPHPAGLGNGTPASQPGVETTWDNAGQFNGQPSAFEPLEGATPSAGANTAANNSGNASDNGGARREALSSFFQKVGIADEKDSAAATGASDTPSDD